VRLRLLRAGAAALALAACSPDSATQVDAVRITDDVQSLVIGKEAREAVVLRDERRRVRVPAQLPRGAELSFGYAISGRTGAIDGPRTDGLAPATLSLAMLRESGERISLFSRRLDPQQARDRRWFDASADLSAWQGEQVTFEFALEPEPGGAAPMAGFWEPTLRTAGPHGARPNLLVVSIDTLRAQNVGAYGHGRDTTPFLDSLAREGVLFENAITSSVTTGPAHMSLFTGLYPVHHGMRHGVERRRADATTVARLLRDAGYHCAAFTEDGYIIRGLGFGDGFSEYTENTGFGRERGAGGGIPGEARVTFAQAQRWLAKSRRQPFFLFVHTYQVHAPYLPPPETEALFQDDGAATTASPELRQHHDAYDREIRFVDDKLRELVAALDAHGLRGSTRIVVLSDHGEEFGEHGYFQHGSALFEESLRIPLVFSGPGIPGGRRVAEPVSLIDVAPTLLALADLPIPQNLDGTNLLPAMRGEAGALPARTLFAEATAPGRWRLPFVREPWTPTLIAARAPDAKLLVHRPETGGEALPTVRYDLTADADEHAPKLLEGEDRAAAEALVDRYLRGRGDGQAPTEAPALDPELRKRLEGLGYLIEQP
jgi:arylsulfatase A-like enzyme